MDNRRIYEQLREVEMALRGAYNRFEQLCEPDLVESEIFLIKCLEAKRNHLIKEARSAEAAEQAVSKPAAEPAAEKTEVETKTAEKIST